MRPSGLPNAHRPARVGRQGMRTRSTAALGLCTAVLAGCVPSDVPARTDAAVRAALTAWTTDFHARRPERICDLFSPDLAHDFRGVRTCHYPEMCASSRRALADPIRRLTCAFDIQAVHVSEDLAAVRLLWTVTTRQAGAAPVTTREQGLDVFRREADGHRRIVMFVAYDVP